MEPDLSSIRTENEIQLKNLKKVCLSIEDNNTIADERPIFNIKPDSQNHNFMQRICCLVQKQASTNFQTSNTNIHKKLICCLSFIVILIILVLFILLIQLTELKNIF